MEPFLDQLPDQEMYYLSFMHKCPVDFLASSPVNDFFMTMSEDGIMKFWHRTKNDIEAVKTIPSGSSHFSSYSVSQDGLLIATAAKQTITVFDVRAFDKRTQFQFSYPGKVILCFLNNHDSPTYELALSFSSQNDILIINPLEFVDAQSDPTIIRRISEIHTSPITAMAWIDSRQICVSIDQRGDIQFWDANGDSPNFGYYMCESSFSTLSINSLTAFSVVASPNGNIIAVCCSDLSIHVFNLENGKELFRFYEDLSEEDNCGLDLDLFLERKHDEEVNRGNNVYKYFGAAFDYSSKILIVPSAFGIKFLDTKDGSLLRVIGRVEKSERYLSVALLQASNDIEHEPNAMPMIIANAYDKQRFYLFTRKAPENSKRDVANEKINIEKMPQINKLRRSLVTQWPTIATLHTTMGSIKFEMWPNETPLAVENFVTHARRGYYDNIRIHRVVRDFCIQTGDPTGTWYGGESIWGTPFEDECPPGAHNFDEKGMVGMANSGPNKNASQFFITTVPAPHLNGKHTCFGKVIDGFENVKKIELVDVDSYQHPIQEIKLVNITFG